MGDTRMLAKCCGMSSGFDCIANGQRCLTVRISEKFRDKAQFSLEALITERNLTLGVRQWQVSKMGMADGVRADIKPIIQGFADIIPAHVTAQGSVHRLGRYK